MRYIFLKVFFFRSVCQNSSTLFYTKFLLTRLFLCFCFFTYIYIYIRKKYISWERKLESGRERNRKRERERVHQISNLSNPYCTKQYPLNCDKWKMLTSAWSFLTNRFWYYLFLDKTHNKIVPDVRYALTLMSLSIDQSFSTNWS